LVATASPHERQLCEQLLIVSVPIVN
jgi:hypothetical protein